MQAAPPPPAAPTAATPTQSTRVSPLFAIAIIACACLPLAGLLWKFVFVPKIDEECVMNGFGAGTCRFTNTGGRAGSMCGYVRVEKVFGNQSYVDSTTICSGEVGSKSTTTIPFTVSSVDTFCESARGRKWNEECGFRFVASP